VSKTSELPLTKEEITKRLSDHTQRQLWKVGVPFSKEIRLASQKVRREPARFNGEFEGVLKAIRAEMDAKKVPADDRLDLVLNDAQDNNENTWEEWLFIHVRFLRP